MLATKMGRPRRCDDPHRIHRSRTVALLVTDGAHCAGHGRGRTELAVRPTPVLLAILIMVTYAAAIPMSLATFFYR